ncbi:MAG: hypothetical protein AAF514_14480, partial [Verrucomicrobiota bacterium]
PEGRLMFETRFSGAGRDDRMVRTMALSSFDDHDALLKRGRRRQSKYWDGALCDHVFSPLSRVEPVYRNGNEAVRFRGPRRDESSA